MCRALKGQRPGVARPSVEAKDSQEACGDWWEGLPSRLCLELCSAGFTEHPTRRSSNVSSSRKPPFPTPAPQRKLQMACVDLPRPPLVCVPTNLPPVPEAQHEARCRLGRGSSGVAEASASSALSGCVASPL